MAYPTRFLRLVSIGTLYGTEQFSWSLSFAPDVGESPSAPTSVPQGVIDAITDLHSASIGIGSAARLTTIKLNEIGTNGRYTSDGDTVLHEYDTPVAGGGSSNMAPQTALAVTLETDANRGRASRGRFYLPATAWQVASDGRLAPAQVASTAGIITEAMNELNAALPGWRAAVMSDVGTGNRRFVRNVAVGRVLDTIRSRRTSLDEDRQAGAELTGWSGGGGPF